MEDDIEQIDEIHEIVEAEPDDDSFPINLGEREAEDDHPKVVQEGQWDDHGPVVTEPTRRIEDEGPMASAKRGEK